jgi:sirohydrochlorin cobaltochelatase
MTRVILSRAAQVTSQFPFPRAPKLAETTLFIAGHGTEKNANSRKAIEHQAGLIRAQQIYADVQSVFMEEEPRIAGCHLLARTKNCVVVPFFISDGMHVVEDLPVLLGEPERVVKARLAAGQPTWRNPTETHGKLFWYSSSVGTDPGMAEVILERVMEACGSRDDEAQTQ